MVNVLEVLDPEQVQYADGKKSEKALIICIVTQVNEALQATKISIRQCQQDLLVAL